MAEIFHNVMLYPYFNYTSQCWVSWQLLGQALDYILWKSQVNLKVHREDEGTKIAATINISRFYIV